MIQAYTNDETYLVRDQYCFKCHEPLPIPGDDIDADDFFIQWDTLNYSAFEGLPQFIRDSFEVRALSKLLCNEQFKDSVRKSVHYYHGVIGNDGVRSP